MAASTSASHANTEDVNLLRRGRQIRRSPDQKTPESLAVYAFEFGAWSAGTYVVRHTFSRTP
jgi:hypothetical protein